jgi:hypothetical protein
MSDSQTVSDTPLVHWTRADVARHLSVSITSVRRMEGCRLHPHVDDAGVRWFDPREVKAFLLERGQRPVAKRDSDGEIAARVFAMFRQGLDLREVVVAAKVPPVIVRGLYSEWLVNLRAGEQARRAQAESATEERERQRSEREAQSFERSLRGTLRPYT